MREKREEEHLVAFHWSSGCSDSCIAPLPMLVAKIPKTDMWTSPWTYRGPHLLGKVDKCGLNTTVRTYT